MKVFLITKDYPPIRGGISDISFCWATEIRRRSGLTVEVITSSKYNRETGTTGYRWNALGIYKIYRKCLTDKPDVIIFNYEPHMLSKRGWPLASIILIYVLAYRFNLILSVHELFIPHAKSLKVKIKSLYQRFSLAVALYHAKAVVVTTHDRVRIVSSIFKKRNRITRLIPNGSIFLSDERVKGVVNDNVRIVYFGSSHPDKGSDIIRDMSRRKEFHGKIFSIGGRLGGGVTDLGFVPFKDLAEKIMEFDIVVLPFIDGASGRRSSFINCLSLGLPIVTTFGASSPPFLKDSGIPYTLTENIIEFPARVHALLSSASARAEAAKASKKLYEEHYSWSEICQTWEALVISVNNRTVHD